MGRKKYSAGSVAVLAASLCVALAVFGGPLNDFDVAVINGFAAERLAHPSLTHAGTRITEGGGAAATLVVTLLGAALLLARGRLFDAGALAAIVLGGRLMVEVLKQVIARERPNMDSHAVTVHSLSFPSGHAANSIIAFVAVVLFCAPKQHRKAALVFAITASLVIGATRPLLGVHWPSDVLAGWIIGILWAVGWWRIIAASSPRMGPGRAALPLFWERKGMIESTLRDPAEQAHTTDDDDEPNLPNR